MEQQQLLVVRTFEGIFFGLLSIRHLQSCISFTVWSVGRRCQNKGQIGAAVRWPLLVVCGRECG